MISKKTLNNTKGALLLKGEAEPVDSSESLLLGHLVNPLQPSREKLAKGCLSAAPKATVSTPAIPRRLTKQNVWAEAQTRDG